MSSVDLKKNHSSLVAAYNEVFNPKSDTDWVLYGYEGQTNVLKVVSKGDGGIEEMIDELNSGKIMYAFCRIQDPNTDLPKFVLINWQGEGVPEIRKGSCTSHMRDISNFLKGAHVTIHARTEDDVDLDDITKKVAKSSGANYSFHKEKAKPEMYEPAGPVGTKYERVKPQLEIKPNIRDKFWKQQQEEEKQRQEELQRKAREDKERMERERRDREAREAREREEKEQERMKKIYERKKAEKEAEEKREADMKKKWEETQIEAMKDDEERRKRADRLRKERANEAQSLVSQRAMNPRQVFEQKTSQFDEPPATTPPPRKLKHGFLNEPTSQFDEPKAPVEPPEAAPVPPEPKAEEPSPPAEPPIRNMLAQNLPKRQDSEEEQAWEDETPETKPQQSKPVEEENVYDDTTSAAPENPVIYDDISGVQPAGDSNVQPAGDSDVQPAGDSDVQPAGDNVYDDIHTRAEAFPPEKGLVARALYDYQACEDNEVSFDPGDLITNIIQIDPGWWVGTTPDGSNGMFPSNYVELLNG